MSRGMSRALRLREMERLYLERAYSDRDMAEVLGVRRETAFEDRVALQNEDEIPFIEVEPGRRRIDRTRYLPNLRVNLHEALALYLAMRRASRQTRTAQPHVTRALEKVALILKQPMTERLIRTASLMAQQPADPARVKVMEDLARGWALRQKVRIHYDALTASKEKVHTLSPYLIEPSNWSDAIYVIAASNRLSKPTPFNVARITESFVTTETFELPEDFDEQELLRYAWGIWARESEPETVRLKFTGREAIKRMRESVWHPLQKEPVEAPDGGWIWEAPVSEWREMIPWIRGWGADVEALEPQELRNELEREAQRLAMVYRLRGVKPEDDLIAHVRRDRKEQLLITHLTQASQLAEGFAAKVGFSEIGKVMGLLHDFGKASEKFQGYLRSNEGLISPDEDGYVEARRGEVDHSTAGAQLAYEKLANRGQEGKILAQFLALAIASHHSGLIDCLKPDGANEFKRRIEKADNDTHLTEARNKLPDIEKQLDEILSQPIEKRFYQVVFETMTEANDSKETRWFKRGLLARFLLSCLLDADRLNTADFENPDNETVRHYGKYISWDVLIERLEAKFTEFAQSTAQMQPGLALDVNQLRAQVAQACLDAAAKPKGIYQLTVPTGGGKTLSSLRFALHHARAHTNDHEKIERIFYIVPYITIIDQNADKVREILEKADERDKVVLEHHSNFVPPEDTRLRHNLLAENWDAPIVFTTQVQFLEALFGSGTRDARRMHQFANAVIIFDEVQTMPIKITHMFTTALRFLVHDCGAMVVLCTATQPPFDNLPNTYRELNITPERHIIQNEEDLFKRLKRVEVHDKRKSGGLTNPEIADLTEHALQEKGSVLIVVNTRASAQALYQEIKGRKLDAATYHLSTNMCPAHRVDVLEEIKAKLKANELVICVSTQLIEAGVDIDFGAVIRALAGLDSVAQSAGRCNRHGMREGLGSVWVVNPQEENLAKLKDIKSGREHAQWVLDDFKDNPEMFENDRIGLKAIAHYYNSYYQAQKDEMDYPVSALSAVGRNDDLFSLLSQNKPSADAYLGLYHATPEILLRQSFRTASREFRVIDSPTRGVVVPYEGGEKVITELCGAFGLEKQGKLLKQAQRYSVNLFDHQFKKLFAGGAIKEVQPEAGIYYLDEQYYGRELGWSDEPVKDMTIRIV